MDAHVPKGSPRLILEIADTTVEFLPAKDGSQPHVRLGKDEVNDLVIDDEAISRLHASIEFKNNDFFCCR